MSSFQSRPVAAGSGNVANATGTATLTATAINTTYITGFEVSGLGATAGVAVLITVTGLLVGTLTFALGIPAGATVPFSYPRVFPVALAASAVNTPIVVTVPAAGAGNTNLTVIAYGFQL